MSPDNADRLLASASASAQTTQGRASQHLVRCTRALWPARLDAAETIGKPWHVGGAGTALARAAAAHSVSR